jgi:hypothetical protein
MTRPSAKRLLAYMTVGTTALNISIECHYAGYHLFIVMLNVNFMLSVAAPASKEEEEKFCNIKTCLTMFWKMAARFCPSPLFTQWLEQKVTELHSKNLSPISLKRLGAY